jgi:hypothetical protein
LVARCLGYKEGRFTEVYNANIGFTNGEAINANPVATLAYEYTSSMERDISRTIIKVKRHDKWDARYFIDIYDKDWSKTPRALSERLNEVISNLRDIGIIVHREHDSHAKSDRIIITNNNYQPTGVVDSGKPAG